MFDKKVKPEEIYFVQPIDGDAYFYTNICFQVKKDAGNGKTHYEYEKKDLATVGALKMFLERNKYNWFEVVEKSFSDGCAHYNLIYYPLRRLKAQQEQDLKRLPIFQSIWEESAHLKGLAIMFTHLIYG